MPKLISPGQGQSASQVINYRADFLNIFVAEFYICAMCFCPLSDFYKCLLDDVTEGGDTTFATTMADMAPTFAAASCLQFAG
jgi:hypothetical protein